jgi:hypothetical protein
MKSTLKTTAAVLRKITGEKDSVWAEDILGKSVHTIRHLEAGTLKLSPAMAARMNDESGISIEWLMDGNPAAPPISQDGREYTKEIYVEVQARKKYQKKYLATVQDFAVKERAQEFFRAVCAILVNANRKRNFYLADYRIVRAIQELRAEFGEAQDLHTIDRVQAYIHNIAPGVVFYLEPIIVPKPKHLRESERRTLQMIRDNFKPESKQPSKKRVVVAAKRAARKLSDTRKKTKFFSEAFIATRKSRPSSRRRGKA